MGWFYFIDLTLTQMHLDWYYYEEMLIVIFLRFNQNCDRFLTLLDVWYSDATYILRHNNIRNSTLGNLHISVICYNTKSAVFCKMGNSHVNGNVESKKVRVGGQAGGSRPGERSGSDTGSSEQVIPTVDRPVVSEDHKEIISRTWRILQEDIARVGVCMFIG